MLLSRRRRKVVEQSATTSTTGFAVPLGSEQPKSLAEMTVKQLKELCKSRGIKGYSNKSESELIEMLMPGGEE